MIWAISLVSLVDWNVHEVCPPEMYLTRICNTEKVCEKLEKHTSLREAKLLIEPLGILIPTFHLSL